MDEFFNFLKTLAMIIGGLIGLLIAAIFVVLMVCLI